MGGTSCDVALIHQGNPVITTQGKINQRPIALPMLDIHTVSAGGGTIARIDAVGGFKSGPTARALTLARFATTAAAKTSRSPTPMSPSACLTRSFSWRQNEAGQG